MSGILSATSTNYKLAAAGWTPGANTVAYYPFSGDANDTVHGNNGTVNGATLVADRKAVANSAYNFNNQSISGSTTAYISTVFTLSMWVKRNGNQLPNAGIVEFGSTGGTGFGLWMYDDTQFGLGQGPIGWRIGSSDNHFADVNYALPNGIWTNVVISYDGSNVKTYADGVLKATNAYSGAISAYSTFLFGDRAGYHQPTYVDLDEIIVENVAWDQTAVTSYYNLTKP